MITQFAKDLRTTVHRSKRASVVPYTFMRDDRSDKLDLWVLLAIHTSSGEVTDLGGGVKKDETDIDTAYREFMEESEGLFSDIVQSSHDLDGCITISRLRNEKTLKPLNTKVFVEGITTIFLPVEPSYFMEIIKKFDNILPENRQCHEITKLICIKGKDILQPTTNKYKMWSFIRKFYFEALSKDLRDLLFASWLQRPEPQIS